MVTSSVSSSSPSCAARHCTLHSIADKVYLWSMVSADAKVMLAHFLSHYERAGIRLATNAAFLVHIIMLILLVVFGLLAAFKMAYWIGMVIITACLGLEHWIARKRSLDWVQKAFFNLNAIISLVFMAMVVVEVCIVPRFISWRLW